MERGSSEGAGRKSSWEVGGSPMAAFDRSSGNIMATTKGTGENSSAARETTKRNAETTSTNNHSPGSTSPPGEEAQLHTTPKKSGEDRGPLPVILGAFRSRFGMVQCFKEGNSSSRGAQNVRERKFFYRVRWVT